MQAEGAYPEGDTLVVASDVVRPFERELLDGVRVRYVDLQEMVRTVTG